VNLACLSVENGGPVQQSSVLNFGFPFLSLSAGVNVICTGMIAFRLLRQRQRMRAVGLHSAGSDEYTSVTGILVESATFYTIATVIYMPFRALMLIPLIPISSIQGAASILCPALIQLRVARGVMYGKSASTDSDSAGGEMRFASVHVASTLVKSGTSWSVKDKDSASQVISPQSWFLKE
jgi:hypothetical protein